MVENGPCTASAHVQQLLLQMKRLHMFTLVGTYQPKVYGATNSNSRVLFVSNVRFVEVSGCISCMPVSKTRALDSVFVRSMLVLYCALKLTCTM
jgi:hypothetical protein